MTSTLLTLVLCAAPSTSPVVVPPELTKRHSMPELSGLAWSEPHQGFLAVSDDTGLDAENTKHAPVVFVLDGSGALQPKAVRLEGLKSLNDAESITPGPKGTFFLATSHSPNTKGKTPKPRRQLLHLQPNGEALAVVGKTDLTGSDAPAMLKALGLPPNGRLDIEGLAYDGEGILFGLKSPLTAEGKAVVARLDNPVEALAGEKPKVSKVVELELCRGSGSMRLCEGISELLRLDDGSLVVAANLPKGATGPEGGAVWWVQAPLGSKAPVEMARWPGLKPEGLARKADGAVLVVFDGDRSGSRFAELPWPSSAPPKDAGRAGGP